MKNAIMKEFIAPPSLPVNPKVLHPISLATFKAFITFVEFPEVEIPINKSPLFAKASTCLSKLYHIHNHFQ